MNEKQLLYAILDSLPKCVGTILSSSENQIRYAHDCRNKAVWFDADYSFSLQKDKNIKVDYSDPLCDEHEKQIDTFTHINYRKEYCYADEIRAWTNYINKTC